MIRHHAALRSEEFMSFTQSTYQIIVSLDVYIRRFAQLLQISRIGG